MNVLRVTRRLLAKIEIPRLPDGKLDLSAEFRVPVSPSVLVAQADGSTSVARFDVHTAGQTDFEPPTDVRVTGNELIGAFRNMALIRRMEAQTQSEYQLKKIRGFCHLYIGQEACITGIEAALTPEDSVITSYRDHAHYLMRGGTVEGLMAEMYGKDNGGSRGKGGSMHFFRPQNGFYGGHGIVGAQVPLGAGIAFKHWYRNPAQPPNVAVVMYGDGAANQGQVFEAFNMAALWRLPAIFVCENNHFGMGTSEGRAAANTAFFKRAEYIPGLKVDGMDYIAVKTAMQYARDWCVNGRGPVIVELDAYRYVGHSMSDPGTTYRSKDDVDAVRQKRDAIAKLKTLMYDLELADQPLVKEIETAVTKHVREENTKAAGGAPSHPDLLWQHVYNNDELPVRACDATDLVYNKQSAPQFV
eukprot:TRINITY_DN11776_c0_g1_i1.p1 TRINITY_DN11776_c0_g1~~TRINITY_DN11776_c0_g1_i1.p1  ORF type:complete len:482 (+),score=87.83 TRINITY_DN11776_c0_g1_i1:202-1446(+)